MRWRLILAVVVLVADGLIHLIGRLVYLRLGETKRVAYKTTSLGGRWDLGAAGIWVCGVLGAVGCCGVDPDNI